MPNILTVLLHAFKIFGLLLVVISPNHNSLVLEETEKSQQYKGSPNSIEQYLFVACDTFQRQYIKVKVLKVFIKQVNNIIITFNRTSYIHVHMQI